MTLNRERFFDRYVLVRWKLAALAILAAQLPVTAPSVMASDALHQCIQETGRDEKACLTDLGLRTTWIPKVDGCRRVAAKTEAILESGGHVKSIDLFFNERCARLGMPHGAAAAAAGENTGDGSPYRQCQETGSWEECDETFGEHRYTASERYCQFLPGDLRNDRKRNRPAWSGSLFRNERCWRLGLSHYEAE